jgi:DNA-binding transcriptional MerR regulator
MTIGSLARRSGVPAATIRYYESIGLLAVPLRRENGYRVYTGDFLLELRFVRRAQALGFTLDSIREILALRRRGASPCQRVVTLAIARLSLLDDQIAELLALRACLAAEIEEWSKPDCGTLDGECSLIDVPESGRRKPGDAESKDENPANNC